MRGPPREAAAPPHRPRARPRAPPAPPRAGCARHPPPGPAGRGRHPPGCDRHGPLGIWGETAAGTGSCPSLVPATCVPVPRLKERPRAIRPKLRMSLSGDQRGYLLSPLLPSQSPNLKKQLQRRARRCPRGRKEKLMLARRETTLQKMEMPKQTRHRKPKVLVKPSKTCEFLITVYFW